MVTDKERSNFCDYFRVAASLRQTQGQQGASGDDKASAARNAFNALFGD